MRRSVCFLLPRGTRNCRLCAVGIPITPSQSSDYKRVKRCSSESFSRNQSSIQMSGIPYSGTCPLLSKKKWDKESQSPIKFQKVLFRPFSSKDFGKRGRVAGLPDSENPHAGVQDRGGCLKSLTSVILRPDALLSGRRI